MYAFFFFKLTGPYQVFVPSFVNLEWRPCNWNCTLHSPRIHPVVYDRVHHRVGHGQPVKAQEQVLHVRFDDYVFVVVRVHEIRMVRKPTDEENRHDHGKHSDHLQYEKKKRLRIVI